jgi:hypothetical protein
LPRFDGAAAPGAGVTASAARCLRVIPNAGPETDGALKPARRQLHNRPVLLFTEFGS